MFFCLSLVGCILDSLFMACDPICSLWFSKTTLAYEHNCMGGNVTAEGGMENLNGAAQTLKFRDKRLVRFQILCQQYHHVFPLWHICRCFTSAVCWVWGIFFYFYECYILIFFQSIQTDAAVVLLEYCSLDSC